jgi:predicted ATPase/DNA-binding SARP family transcriptional activator/DNA-binding CsgD family transcriptional regulator
MREKPQQALRVELLGGFRVSVGARTVGEDGWRLKKAKSLLKLLALSPGYPMHREQLAQWLWPGSSDPKSQANNLRQALHAARHALVADPAPAGASSDDYLRLVEDLVALCPEGPLWVDVEAFEKAATTARRLREPAAHRAAIDLYTGELLPEDRYEGWTEEKREGLRATYLSLLGELAVLHEEREEFEGAIEALRKAVVAEPTREEAHASLMRLYSLTQQHQEALLQYEQLRKALLDELGTEPGEAGRLLYEEIRAGRASTSGLRTRTPSGNGGTGAEPYHSSRHNLPIERTSFVGRQEEMVEVEKLLSMTSLLTLTGAGGSGKTRFALEVARRLAGAYRDGAWLVELAPLSEPELVERAVAHALEVRAQPGRSLTDVLKDSLRAKTLLLVPDNCEHLIEAVARLAETLLDSCPNLKVLATSREALNLSGELIWRMPSLSTPNERGGSSPTAEELARCEAVRLFVERARYRRPSFELASENAGAVAEVCRRLEGIPLAIELAAARVGVLSVGQIAARLKDSLGMLAGGNRTAPSRQRTLRGTLEWSFELLGELEQKLFGRLSVFLGGWSLEAAEAVGAESGSGIEQEDVLNLLSRLVDKSLVVAEAARVEGELRYRMLEPVRQYGREKLEESDEVREVRRRHATWFFELAEEAAPHLKGRRQVEWLERLEKEHDNLRAAMRFLLEEGEIEAAVRLVWALWMFWWYHRYQGEGRRYAEEALEKGNALPTGLRARALFVRATMTYGLESPELTMRLFEESAALFRQAGDKPGLALGLSGVGGTALQQGDVERATALLEESLRVYRELGDKWGISATLVHPGIISLKNGDYARATRYFEEALAVSREVGTRLPACISLYNLAFIARAEADHKRAVQLYLEGLELAAEAGDKANAAYCLEGLASLSVERGEPQRAAQLFGTSEELLEAIGAPLYAHAPDRTLYEHAVDDLRSRLGEEACGALWTKGRAMTLEQAIEYALSEDEEPPTEALTVPEEPLVDSGQRPATLTPREREVAALVAQELTDHRIAKELVISERTVTTHVHKILKKLNLRSRVQIAAWAMEQELLR